MSGFDPGTRLELHRDYERGMARDLEHRRLLTEVDAQRRAERRERRIERRLAAVERRRAAGPALKLLWVRLTGRAA